ncbi:hypothetical protein M3625_12795 [Paenibacillus sp. MER 78]|nr:hypothetical protein [Paenibacillus sp. MER 78]
MRKDKMPHKVEYGVSTKVFSGSVNRLTAPTLNITPVTMVEFNNPYAINTPTVVLINFWQ